MVWEYQLKYWILKLIEFLSYITTNDNVRFDCKGGGF